MSAPAQQLHAYPILWLECLIRVLLRRLAGRRPTNTPAQPIVFVLRMADHASCLPHAASGTLLAKMATSAFLMALHDATPLAAKKGPYR